MFCTFKGGVFKECRGNVEFSPTVYQPAETLTDEQKAQFNVYVFVEERPTLLPDNEYIEQWTYRLENGVVFRTWAQQPIPQAKRDAMLAQKIDTLWKAADGYQMQYISGVAIGLLTIGVIQQKPKALAVQAWSATIWDLYYQRKAALTYNGDVNTDFTSCGPMPHTIPELRQELGM